jgi:Tol biopolymer transport system component
MKTRKVTRLSLTLALACFVGLPAISRAQSTNELAMVANICTASSCGGSALVFPGGMTNGPNDRAPTWSPDGAQIAFERDGEIMVINVVGGGPSNVTNHPAQESSPAWSPDGSKIAFASDRDGQVELYLMNPEGSSVVRLTSGVGFISEPAWSPDAARIAFTCVVESGNVDICVVNADGAGFGRLTTDPAYDSGPAWSPDSARIAFATTRYSPTPLLGPSQLALMNADGSGVSQVGPSGTWGFDPSWSPDGTRILFVDAMQVYPDYFLFVWVINADGTGQTEVAEGYDPAWKPPLDASAAQSASR